MVFVPVRNAPDHAAKIATRRFGDIHHLIEILVFICYFELVAALETGFQHQLQLYADFMPVFYGFISDFILVFDYI